MSVVGTLMAAKAAYGVGKGVMDWLNAKNRKFKLTPEERRAQQLAARQSVLGMGGESFQTAANTLRAQSAEAGQQVRANAFRGGLENSAVTRVGQEKVTAMSNRQLSDLALRIADRNTQFREKATQRKTAIDMQIGQRRRQFNENRDAQMRAAGTRTVLSLFDLGIKAGGAIDANNQAKALATESAAVENALDPIVTALENGDQTGAIAGLNNIAEMELTQIDVGGLMKMLKAFMQSMTKDDVGVGQGK